jgi:hypothetical protein
MSMLNRWAAIAGAIATILDSGGSSHIEPTRVDVTDYHLLVIFLHCTAYFTYLY